jgi:hypothetical protein
MHAPHELLRLLRVQQLACVHCLGLQLVVAVVDQASQSGDVDRDIMLDPVESRAQDAEVVIFAEHVG